MDGTIPEAKNQLARLIRAVQEGESVVIARDGTPVAEIVCAPAGRRKVRFGSMGDGIRLHPGWDEPMDVGRFLDGGL